MAHKRKVNNKAVDVLTKVISEQTQNNDDIKPLTQKEGSSLQEMVDISNTYAALVEQYKKYSYMINALKKRAEQFKNGNLNPPVMIALSQKIFYAENDRNKIIKYFEDEIYNFDMARQGIIGTMQHRKDEFIECLIRVHRILGDRIKDKELTDITRFRSVDDKTKDDEKKLLEKELDSMLKD